MRLIEIIRDLELLENEGTICVLKPWTENSPAVVAVKPEAADSGMEYFMDVFIAREFLDGWASNLDTHPTLEEKCLRLIQYAINDA